LKHKNAFIGKLINNSNISLGIILGSGVELKENLIANRTILHEDNTGIHRKQVFTCSIAGKNVIVFKGRKHYYEGHSEHELTGNILLAHKMNVKDLLITNAAGGVNENFHEGDLMLITSHINFIEKLTLKGSAFPYSFTMAEKLRKVCSAKKVMLHEGVYGCYPGPSFETKAEVRMQKRFLVDAAGMSTVPEVLLAGSLGMNVIALSVITNLLKESPLGYTSHSDVLSVAWAASDKLNSVVSELISELN